METNQELVKDPKMFINRELSWLRFNERVLEEAKDPSLPLFERLKFLAISSSNLDEFFMVRVAGIKVLLAGGGVAESSGDGMLPAEQLEAISAQAHAMVAEQDRLWRKDLVPALAGQGIAILEFEEMDANQRNATKNYFASHVFPVLTPLAVDPGHPFPRLRNKSLNIAVMLRKEGSRRRRERKETALAVVQVPSVIERLVALPGGGSGVRAYTLLERLIAAYAGDLFPGFGVTQTAVFRVTRNWDILVDEEESEDLLSTVQQELRRSDRGKAVRLEVATSASTDLVKKLSATLQLDAPDIYRMEGPFQLPDVMALVDHERAAETKSEGQGRGDSRTDLRVTAADARPDLRVEPFTPVVPANLREGSIFAAIAKQDVLLHHPYESFDPVVRFVEEAAFDPSVLAIKQTLYRTSGNSPLVAALFRAAHNGKQVTVLVEIKARFDEANNIAWARRLEENGVHVVYGLMGLKTHCKASLVVRREGGGIRRYVHLGTGNYNSQTARQYTDLSLFTARPEIADDVTALFNLLTGYSEPPQWKRFTVAPFGLQERTVELIDRQAERARAGESVRIMAKMNALVDPVVIRSLYAASQAGVKIDLLVRGICCLRPGVPGVSENIRVRSIVDRFLEHSRVFAFLGGPGPGNASAEVYLSSADWMPRNFHRRIEVMFPVEDPGLRDRVLDEVLGVAWTDNVKSRELLADGTYRRVRPAGKTEEAESQDTAGGQSNGQTLDRAGDKASDKANGHGGAQAAATNGQAHAAPNEPEVRSQMALLERARRQGVPKAAPERVLRHASAPAVLDPAPRRAG